jgi:K+-sensing histidine kinase KdpD
MKETSFAVSTDLVTDVIRAVVTISALTAVMFLVGRAVLGEAVIAMAYLLAVAWLTIQTGQAPGLSAALTAALMFDFFFIPPFFTFNIGSVEGWLVLVIFVLVAVIQVNRIQARIAQAQSRENEASLLYELSMALVGLCSREDIAHTLAEQLQQLYQVAQAQVTFFEETQQPAITASAPLQPVAAAKPDQVVPILTARHLIGEIRLWKGKLAIPTTTDRLLQKLASQISSALQRLSATQAERASNA